MFLILAILAGSLVFFYYNVTTPPSPEGGYVEFEIIPKEKKIDIAQKLAEKGIVTNKWTTFGYWAVMQSKIKSGKYSLSPNYNLIKITDILTNAQVNENKILIKEGQSSWEIAKNLAEKKLVDYQEAYSAFSKEEGYLFPDTYRIAENSTLDDIIKILKDNFTRRIEGLNVTKDSLIVASLLEREGKTNEERKMIASIIQNRLDINMTLDIDATVQYAKGSWEQINRSDIQSINSLYNTYKNKGLPPGPICNPGLDSIKASLEPTKNDYLYYFHSRDSKIIYSKTLQEHQNNIAKYGVSGS